MAKQPQLNEYAWQFAQSLFAAFPKWREWVVETQPPVGNLRVNVPSRFGPHLPLYITTAHDMIEIGWGFCHAHFREDEDVSRQDCFRDAIRFLQEFVSDTRVIVDDWKNGKVAGCTMCLRDEIGRFIKPTSTVRSWSGRHDVGVFDCRKLY